MQEYKIKIQQVTNSVITINEPHLKIGCMLDCDVSSAGSEIAFGDLRNFHLEDVTLYELLLSIPLFNSNKGNGSAIVEYQNDDKHKTRAYGDIFNNQFEIDISELIPARKYFLENFPPTGPYVGPANPEDNPDNEPQMGTQIINYSQGVGISETKAIVFIVPVRQRRQHD